MNITASAMWTIVALVIAGAAPSQAESLSSRVKREIEARDLCATQEFDALEVDVDRGVTRVSAGFGDRVRKGERLLVEEIDISGDGMELEIELKTDGGRGDSVDIEVQLRRSIRGAKNEFINGEDLWKALNHVTGPCSGADGLDQSVAPVDPVRAREERRDPCAVWTLEGYKLGMAKTEALFVRPTHLTRLGEFTARGEAGRFHYATLYFGKDERLSGVFVWYAVSKKKELEVLIASFTERFGNPALENVKRVSGILPYRQTVWGSPDCDSKVYVNAFYSFGFLSDVYTGLAPALGAEPATPVTTSERLQFPGYSIHPPAGEGWIRSEGGEERIHALFYKQTFRKGHTIAAKAHGRVLDLPSEGGPPTSAELLRRFVDGTDLLVDAKRFEPISVTSSADDSLGFECRRFDQVVKDRGMDEREGVHLFENHGYVCAHPDYPGYLVSVDYSQRTPAGLEPSTPREEGEAFLRSLVLEPLGIKVESIPISHEPRFMALARGSVWVSHEPDAVSRIDPKTRAVLATIKVGRDPVGMVATEEAVWVVNREDRSVSRIDPEGDRVIATIKVGKAPWFMAAGAGSLWVANKDGGSVTRIDPKTNKVVADIRVGKSAQGIASGGGAIFVSDYDEGTVIKIDPSTNKVVSRFKVGSGPALMLYAADQLWIANLLDDAVVRVDPISGNLMATVQVGHAPSNLVLHGGTIWVANIGDDTLSVIDPEVNEVVGRFIPVGHNPLGLLEVDGELWVAHRRGSSIARLIRSERGHE